MHKIQTHPVSGFNNQEDLLDKVSKGWTYSTSVEDAYIHVFMDPGHSMEVDTFVLYGVDTEIQYIVEYETDSEITTLKDVSTT